jgi:hypothetical protein
MVSVKSKKGEKKPLNNMFTTIVSSLYKDFHAFDENWSSYILLFFLGQIWPLSEMKNMKWKKTFFGFFNHHILAGK